MRLLKKLFEVIARPRFYRQPLFSHKLVAQLYQRTGIVWGERSTKCLSVWRNQYQGGIDAGHDPRVNKNGMESVIQKGGYIHISTHLIEWAICPIND